MAFGYIFRFMLNAVDLTFNSNKFGVVGRGGEVKWKFEGTLFCH